MSDTFSHEGPECPYCGRQYTADDAHYFDEQNYTSQECDECGQTFDVSVNTSTMWTCERRTTPPPEAAATEEDREGGR